MKENAYQKKQNDEAFAALDSVQYKGEGITFTFWAFQNDLQSFGELVLESKKVWDLLTKITDPKLEVAKQTVHITKCYNINFEAAINFLV